MLHRLSILLAVATLSAWLGGCDPSPTPMDDLVDIPEEVELPCDPIAQSGCPESMRCLLSFNTGNGHCVTAVAPSQEAPPHGLCNQSGIDNCPPGYQCISLDGTSAHCHPFCLQESRQGCPETMRCLIDPPVPSAFAFCTAAQSCHVLTQDCGEDQTCVGGIEENLGLIMMCQPVGGSTQNQACEEGRCAKGLACISTGGPAFCATYCDEGEPSCPVTTTCQDGAALGFVDELAHVGVCL